jgi:hypothetical protein
MTVATRVIVTHRAALTAKYGTEGFDAVGRAVAALSAADEARGVATSLIALDDAADMQRVGGAAAARADDVAAVKAAVDAVCAHAAVDYLTLLGAPDVVPQIALQNPLWTGDPADDPDPVIPSDLPYACDAPYGTSASAFKGPTRVVGRLPDLVAARDPAYLLALLDHATRWTTLHAPRPIPVFALSTLSWRLSTETSIAALGGAAGPVRTCPNDGPVWDEADLAAPLHFVNCHGNEFDPTWYGEKFRGQQTLPHAVEAALLRAPPGVVVAAECCYGAMHWDPAAANGQPGVAATYLRQGAAGVFGASTLSYGPAAGNGSADVIARMFLEAVAGGASLGHAALAARQRFVAHAATLDPTDLKTLAQFDLLGDPTVHAIAAVAAGEAAPEVTPAAAPVSHAAPGRLRPGVRQRRHALASIGKALESTVATTRDTPRQTAMTRERLAEISGVDVDGAQVRTFDTTHPDRDPATYHVAFVPGDGRRRLVVVRTEPGVDPVVRHLDRK